MPGEASDDLATWGLHCFCPEAVATPHRVVREDGNGRLLFATVGGATLASLEARGIAASESQLAGLQAWGLLEREGSRAEATWTTAFPVLGPDVLAPLRARSAELGDSLAAALVPAVHAIRATLEGRRLGESTYAVVFGDAVDARVWEILRSGGRLPDTRLDRDHPSWRGVFWAIHPERPGGAGINFVGGGAARLAVLWSDVVLARAQAFGTSALARQAVAALRERPDGATLPAELTRDGRPAIAIVAERPDDPLHRASVRIATTVCEALTSGAAQRLAEAVPAPTLAQSLVIATHELLWDVMDALVRRGALAVPSALEDPCQPQASAVVARVEIAQGPG